ncbi:hypothetical protein [Plebeiibacterium marinum]|uniref:Uncharacterized protein n=1 Tax=Plebeiibacterium marinum TaxID=2992111 RepID=A0AAE3MFV3_9BACT|nr:hypothetical protein [Plebeiobacterium marinum]MCW3807064.1 hypothetical protein [Plebeiobacterium marinum]
MIRIDIQKKIDYKVTLAIEELLQTARTQQLHPCELLLVQQHGHFWNINGKKEYMIGPGEVGLSAFSHINYIYRQARTFHWQENLDYKTINKNQLTAIEDTIHSEKLLYLKIWENNYLLELFTQLSILAQGKHYDWDLEIPTTQKSNTKADHIRNNIKNPLQNLCPKFYEILNKSYSQQLRNAIAHSQYEFIQGGIKYLNYNPSKFCTIEAMGYTDWEERIAYTFAIFFGLHRLMDIIQEAYAKKTLAQGNSIEVKIPYKDGYAYQFLTYIENQKRWVFKH